MRGVTGWVGLSLALASGCGGSTENSVNGGGSGGGTGASGGSGGTGGQVDAGCVGFIDLSADYQAPKHLSSVCPGQWGADESGTPVGYQFMGGPYPGTQALVIMGCVSSSPSSEGITLSASNATTPGSYTKGTTSYTDTSGISWGFTGDPFQLTVTRLDPPGGVVEGTFSAIATHGGDAAHSVSGSFHVCRVADMLAP